MKFIPREILEPWVIFDFFGSIETESIIGFSLDESVYEVSAFNTPTRRDLMTLYLYLFR